MGKFYRHLAIFYWSHCHQCSWTLTPEMITLIDFQLEIHCSEDSVSGETSEETWLELEVNSTCVKVNSGVYAGKHLEQFSANRFLNVQCMI